MAKIVSHIASSIRGSIAGITYLTTQAGAIIARQRVIPVNPRSSTQGLIRNAMANAAALWETATEANRSDWTSWALEAGFRTGRQAFCACASFLTFLNQRFTKTYGIAVDPPIVPGKISISNVHCAALAAPGTGIAVKFTVDETIDWAAHIRVQGPFPLSRTSWRGQWSDYDSKNTDGAASGEQTVNFTGLQVGYRYFFTIRVGQEGAANDGMRISNLFNTSFIAETTV